LTKLGVNMLLESQLYFTFAPYNTIPAQRAYELLSSVWLDYCVAIFLWKEIISAQNASWPWS